MNVYKDTDKDEINTETVLEKILKFSELNNRLLCVHFKTFSNGIGFLFAFLLHTHIIDHNTILHLFSL